MGFTPTAQSTARLSCTAEGAIKEITAGVEALIEAADLAWCAPLRRLHALLKIRNFRLKK